MKYYELVLFSIYRSQTKNLQQHGTWKTMYCLIAVISLQHRIATVPQGICVYIYRICLLQYVVSSHQNATYLVLYLPPLKSFVKTQNYFKIHTSSPSSKMSYPNNRRDWRPVCVACRSKVSGQKAPCTRPVEGHGVSKNQYPSPPTFPGISLRLFADR